VYAIFIVFSFDFHLFSHHFQLWIRRQPTVHTGGAGVASESWRERGAPCTLVIFRWMNRSVVFVCLRLEVRYMVLEQFGQLSPILQCTVFICKGLTVFLRRSGDSRRQSDPRQIHLFLTVYFLLMNAKLQHFFVFSLVSTFFCFFPGFFFCFCFFFCCCSSCSTVVVVVVSFH
jgi:hypothetical protein